MSRIDKNKEKTKNIINSVKKEKVHKTVKYLIIIFIIILLIFTSFILYSRYIATKGIIVKEEKLVFKNLPNSFHGLKVVHFSDLHYGSTIFDQELSNLVKMINKTKPDLVLFTGDLFNENYNPSTTEKKSIISYLKGIDSKIGKYAVLGNHDYEYLEIVKDILISSNFNLVNNDYELIYYKDYTPILLTGINSSLQDDADIEASSNYFNEENANKNIFTIAIFHEPDNIIEIQKLYTPNLALAGHSHNGQVRIPFINSLIKIEGAKKYDQAFYKVNGTNLYISGGIGTSVYRLRLFNRPSFNLFRLVNK